MGKQIHNLVLSRRNRNEAFGFRIIGGKDEGLSFKVEKVVIGSPAKEAGLLVHDFLISVQGKEIFDCTHQEVVKLIREAGNSLNLSIERGDFIVPNFEEIWPSGRKKANEFNPSKGIEYVEKAMNEGLPGIRDQLFTTVGKPKVEVHQYDNPIECYSKEVLEEMSERGSWKHQQEVLKGAGGQVPGANPPVAPFAGVAPEGSKFTPQNSAVMAVIKDQRSNDQGNTSYTR